VIPVAEQQRMCEQKRTYMDATTARVYASIAARKAGKPMRVYLCPNCRFWHLTTRPA
jgi:uncharacterized protein YlaI